MRSARTSRISALVCDSSVTMPACEPVSEIARWPRSLIAIAHSAQEIRSPVESSMSISRGSGVGETSSAIAISSSVVLPRAESTATTEWPSWRFSTIRCAARLMRSASATDVPPNFMTMIEDMAAQDIGPRQRRGQRVRRPAKALPSVTSSAYSRSEPTGSPLARRVTLTCGRARAELFGDVQRRRLPGRGRVGREHDFADGGLGRLDARHQLGDPQVLRVDPVDRRERPAEHVVDAVVLVGALHRDHVAGLLDDADHLVLAPCVLADPAARLVGEVEADLAQADPLLDLDDRRGERGGVLGRGAKDVEREPLRGAVADPGQL